MVRMLKYFLTLVKKPFSLFNFAFFIISNIGVVFN